MGLTVTINKSWRINSKLRRRDCTIAFDASHLAAGEVVTPSDFLLKIVESMTFFEMTDGYIPSFDKTNGKLLAWYGDYSNGSDGPLIVVPDTTNLAAVSVRAVVEGF